MKEKVSFTIDEKLMEFFRYYCKQEYTTMSATISDYILKLKRETEAPKKKLRSTKTSHY